MAGFHTKTFINHDDYMTPKSAWEKIQHIIPKDKILWEAFYGDGKSGDYLIELGYNVIHENIDFFDDNTRPEYDILVSNPPYGKSKEIMNKLYEMDKPFILIMPTAKLTTSYIRSWQQRGIQIILPRKRIQFIKNGNEIQNKCNFDCFYYCYKINLPRDIIWLEE